MPALPLSSPRQTRRAEAFSLIEVVLALGIVSFAMLSILGLIPVGLHTFRHAMNLSIEATIAQQLVSDVQRSDFANITTRHFTFDDQGLAVGPDQAVFTVSVEAPQPVASSGILRSDAAARMVLIKITNRQTPGVTNCYPVIVPSAS